jgi:UDP:flavonoid glycosyltransferase YjiC (YdhE family)
MSKLDSAAVAPDEVVLDCGVERGQVVPDSFGAGLPTIRDWTEQHFAFTGYIPGFDPGSLPSRAELGYDEEPLCVVSVGGSGVGASLLHRVIECLPAGLRTLVVTGPRIDPDTVPRRDGIEVRGYVHELYKYLAACDVAVVQGGLTTTMELVAARRPFVSIHSRVTSSSASTCAGASIATARRHGWTTPT